MEIQKVTIKRRASYEENAGLFDARIEFKDSSHGETIIPLSTEVGTALLEFLAPALVKFSEQAVGDIAKGITAQIEGIKNPAIAIEDKKE